MEGILGIPAKEAFRSDRLRSESPMVLPSVPVMTTLVAEVPGDGAAGCAGATGAVGA